MDTEHRFVVVGCGALGSAALHWLARVAGDAVVGLDPTPDADPRPGIGVHLPVRGADAAVAAAAHRAWRDVERVSGQRLLTVGGGLVVEDVVERVGAGTSVVDAVAATARDVRAEHEVLDAAAVTRRWPQFHLGGWERAVHLPGAGVVDRRRAARVHRTLARGHGAAVVPERVRALRPAGDGVEVVTDTTVRRARHVVVTAGAASAELLTGLGYAPALGTRREQVTTFTTPRLLEFAPARFPVFRWHGATTLTGRPVDDELTTAVTTAAARPGTDLDGHRADLLGHHLPGFAGAELASATHVVATGADGHPVLGPVPGGRASTAVGDAGGAASLCGRVLAELATTGRTRYPLAVHVPDRVPPAGAPSTAGHAGSPFG